MSTGCLNSFHDGRRDFVEDVLSLDTSMLETNPPPPQAGLIMAQPDVEGLLHQRFRVSRYADVKRSDRVLIFQIYNVDAVHGALVADRDILRISRYLDL